MSTQARVSSVPRGRRAVWPFVLGALVLLVVVALGVGGVVTDRLWYRALGYGSVFSTLMWTRVLLFLVFAVISVVLVVGNAVLAHRLRPGALEGPVASPLLERYRAVLQTRFVQVVVVTGLIVALFSGLAASSQVMTWLAWLHAEPVGQQDPRFGFDLSFFLFAYPWWRWVISSVLTTLVLSAVAAAVVHYVMGALRADRLLKISTGRQRPQWVGPRGGSHRAQAHLSVLVAAILVVHAVGLWFDRYATELGSGGLLTGLTWTDQHARIPAATVLSVLSLICAALFVVNAFWRRWAVPAIAIVLMVLSGLLVGVIYPAVVQAFQVKPDEPDRERPFIAQHIAATRQAYGIADTSVEAYSPTQQATTGQLRADAATLPGIRLMDPARIGPAFEQLQQVRGYYSFKDVLDVDRYGIDGESTDAVVAARELDPSQLNQAARSWNSLHTSYTHGFGLVAAYGNRKQAGGEPEWIEKDIPPVGPLGEYEPRIYFGEKHTDFSVVGAPPGTPPVEVDVPGSGDSATLSTYTGKGGVGIGNWAVRALYALRFADVNLLLSDRVNAASKILYVRSPRERVQAAAPWLTVDSTSYPAVVDGRLVWIVDGYTTSNSYPNSSRSDLGELTRDSDTATGPESPLDGRSTPVNYLRNSVKAVVDAYDGTVSMYAWDESDPVLQTWRRAFPDTVRPKAQISAGLLSHLRYPRDLFEVQRAMLQRYHQTDPQSWYSNSDLWTLPKAPDSQYPSPAYYMSLRMPGQQAPTYALNSTFLPFKRQNLAGFVSVNSDATSGEYGRLRVLRLADNTPVDGPGLTYNVMNNDPRVAEALRPYTQNAQAKVVYGNVLTTPIGGGVLYVMPVYTQRTQGDDAYPGLRYVVARFGSNLGIGSSLQEALDQIFDGSSGASTGEGRTPAASSDSSDSRDSAPRGADDEPAQDASKRPPLTDDQRARLEQAEQAFTKADEALRKGDLATYQQQNAAARTLVEQALGR